VLIGSFSFINPDYASAMARIKAIPGYADLFRKEFPGDPDPVTPDNWAKAIGAFQRTLVTPVPIRTPFSRAMLGRSRRRRRTGFAQVHRYRVHRLPQRRGTSAAASSKSSASSRIIGPRRGARSRTKAAST